MQPTYLGGRKTSCVNRPICKSNDDICRLYVNNATDECAKILLFSYRWVSYFSRYFYCNATISMVIKIMISLVSGRFSPGRLIGIFCVNEGRIVVTCNTSCTFVIRLDRIAYLPKYSTRRSRFHEATNSAGSVLNWTKTRANIIIKMSRRRRQIR